MRGPPPRPVHFPAASSVTARPGVLRARTAGMQSLGLGDPPCSSGPPGRSRAWGGSWEGPCQGWLWAVHTDAVSHTGFLRDVVGFEAPGMLGTAAAAESLAPGQLSESPVQPGYGASAPSRPGAPGDAHSPQGGTLAPARAPQPTLLAPGGHVRC